MTRALVLGLTLASALVVGPAFAADPLPTNKQADLLFREGRKLMTEGKYGEACGKLAESQKLDPAAGTLLNLGDCYEKSARNGDAVNAYREAAKAAALRNRLDWITLANQRLAILEPKVGTLTISFAPGADIREVKVERDGIVVPPESLGQPLATDPGAHFIAVSAPARKPWSTRIEVAAQKKAAVEIPILDIEGLEGGPKSSSGVAKEEKPAESGGGTTRILGFVVAGVGVAGLGVGTFFGISALSKKDDASTKCPSYPERCDAEAVDPNDAAKTSATISTISLIAGGALTIAGVVLVLTAPSKREKSTSIRITPMGVAGTF